MKLKIIFFCLLNFHLFAQISKIDSLRGVLNSGSQKERVENNLILSELFLHHLGNADSMLHYAIKAEKIAASVNYTQGIIKAKLNVSIAYYSKNQYDTSIAVLQNLLVFCSQKSNDSFNGDIYYNLGLNYRRLNNYKLAVDNYLKAISIYEKTDNLIGRALANCRLAGVFVYEKQPAEALKYANKAKQIVSRISEPYSKVTIYSSLTAIHIQLSIDNKSLIDSAINYAKKALELVNAYEFYSQSNQLYNAISNAYYLKEDMVNSIDYCKQSLRYRKFLLPNEILLSYLNLADCYNRIKQNTLALNYLDSGKIFVRSLNDPYYEMSIYERIYAYNKDAGNYKESLEGIEKFKAIQDSLFNAAKSEAINDLEQRYNKSENEKEINALNKEKLINYLNLKILIFGIIASTLIIIVIVFFYRQSVLKNKFRSLEVEQRLNRARMNPHFFFNALSSIQTLSMDKENSGKVSKLISQFSKIMRQALESTYDDLSTIETEIDFLKNYLNIQKSRFGDKFDYTITIDEDLEVNEIKIPGMLLQPFIENSIEHGFKNINYEGKIEISFLKDKEQLKISVSDNGIGFDQENNAKKYPSRATQIITDRLLLLNRKYRSTARFELIKNKESGITVLLYIPIIY